MCKSKEQGGQRCPSHARAAMGQAQANLDRLMGFGDASHEQIATAKADFDTAEIECDAYARAQETWLKNAESLGLGLVLRGRHRLSL